MLNSELAQTTQLFPEGMRRDYDAHIYYSEKTRPTAQALLRRAEIAFRDRPAFVGRLIDRCVGPHPSPMFEINFPRELLAETLRWLMHERGNLSVLIHEVTGDDPKDHAEGALWLGEPVPLDFSKLDPSPISSGQ